MGREDGLEATTPALQFSGPPVSYVVLAQGFLLSLEVGPLLAVDLGEFSILSVPQFSQLKNGIIIASTRYGRSCVPP